MYAYAYGKGAEVVAKMNIQMPEDLLLKMSKLGSEFDSTAEKVLQAGGDVFGGQE